ncbi:MAG: hypothetical protein H6Q89_3923, partial [Myxococcaceae bacterium]|nr:hypothetical protein [Myxococcaceae bacterium]
MVLLLTALLGVGGCKGGGPAVEKKVGPDGATLEGAGATLVVPAGALAESVTLFITRLDEAAAAGLAAPQLNGAAVERAGDVFELTPHGTTFSTAVSFSFPAGSAANLVMRLDDRADATWERVDGATFANGMASFESSRFSLYGAFRIADPGTACERAKCGENETRSCASNGTVACWKPLNGITLPLALGVKKYTQLTTSTGVDLDRPDAAPYASFLSAGEGSFVTPPAMLVLSFLPLKAEVGPQDLITTEPFPLATALPSGGPSLLDVRAVFPLEGADPGYLVIGSAKPGLYAGRPVVLLVRPGTAGAWRVNEIIPQLGRPGPYTWTQWSEFRLAADPVFAVRQGNSVHILLHLNEPSAQTAGTTHRFTIPVTG